MNRESVISTKELSIGYFEKKHSKVIASEINLDLKSGKLIALIGTNGVGKSTLLRTLTLIQPAISGEIIIDGQDLKKFSALDFAQKISVVLTESLAATNLTVFDLVALGRQPYTNWIGKLKDSDLAKINESLKLTESNDLAHRKFYELSDGQRQNILIARALAQDTSIIILDEPMTHLDFSYKAALFSMLKKLSHKTGKCILFSTHDIDMALQLSDELLVMTLGKVKQGIPDDFINDGTFDQFFPNKSVEFDREKRRFVFRNI